MNKKQKNFTITLSAENFREIKSAREFLKDKHKDVLYFSFEHKPNLSVGDIFTTRVDFDEEISEGFDSEVVGICPPLPLPANKESFESHISILSEFMADIVIDKIKNNYFAEKAKRLDWTIFFKKCEDKG